MRRLLVAFVIIAGTSLIAAPVFAYSSPGHPSGYVNDFAHVLSADTKQNLEQELTAFQATTSSEIAVAIVPNMGGDYLENYAVKLFAEWKIGKAKQDNGVLLLLSIEEHKMRIEVGYGLEGALPDSLAQSILDNEMTPRLKAGDYDGAVTAGVQAIEAATRGEYSAPSSTQNISSVVANNFMGIMIAFIFGFQFLASIFARSKSWWAGGVVGVVAGIATGWYVGFALALTLAIAAFFGLFGLVLDYIVSNTYRDHIGRGATPPWWIGGGGFGGGSGGSFGGFGGGSSGGGGASGGW